MSDDPARSPELIMPAAAAAMLLTWLERRGAIASLTGPEDYIHVNLDGIADLGHTTAERLAFAVLALRAELRHILIARRVLH